MGVIVKASNNVFLKDNIVFGFKQAGVWFDIVKNVTIDGNFVGHISERPTFSAAMFVDFWAGISICTLFSGKADCTDITVRNNVVAGVPWVGLTMPGHTCGGSNEKRRNNTVHSVRWEGYGSGINVYPDKGD